MAGAQHAAVQRLQFFLSESRWDPDRVNARRLELLRADPATAPHGGGVLVIDDSGDRKDGARTAHVGRQWLGRYGKTDNGVVTVTTVWADERLYYPVDAVPYTPARHFAKGKSDPGFRTKLAIGADLAVRARDAGFAFRAVAADSAYGDQDGFRGELAQAGLPFVMALKPRHGTWAYGPDAHTPADAARALAWHGPDDPGDWEAVTRTFRDGHTETWWAADARLGWWGPDGTTRLVVATADPGTLPDKATWYLATNLPRPGGPREGGSPHPAADLAEIVRIYGIRHWIEQSYKQVKDELGWADFQVRSDVAIRRHRCWSTARSASAGMPGSLITRRTTTSRPRSRNPAAERGGPPAAAPARRRRRGPGRSGPSEPGFPRGSHCSAGGPPGPRRPRPASSRNCSTPSAQATACTYTSTINKLPLTKMNS